MTSSEPIRFAVVGSGWRSEFFVRLARMAPDHLAVAGVVTRSAERAQHIAGEWGVPAMLSLDALADASGEPPEFVVTSVPWDRSPETIEHAVHLGFPVLAETPPAPTAEGLRALWASVGGSGQVQVAEQYLLMPGHAARLGLVRSGLIGSIGSVQVSSTHLYHATSMIRVLLGAGFDPVEVTARSFPAPLLDPLTPAGWTDATEPREATTTLALLDFGEGRSGVYDFTDNQWWNPLRARRIVVRGSHGEIVDDTVTRMADPRTPVQSALVRRQLGIDLNLEGVELDSISFDGGVVYRNPFPGARFSDDDLAVATILRDMGHWVRGHGPAPYPLAGACQDHLIGLAIEESARLGTTVTTGREAWAS